MRAISDTRSRWSPSNKKLVIVGHVPGLNTCPGNPSFSEELFFWMDARIKSGHDEKLL
jgi:hypothetical protein